MTGHPAQPSAFYSRRLSSMLAAVIVIALAACAAPDEPPTMVAGEGMPSLERFVVPGFEQTAQVGLTAKFALASNGTLAFTNSSEPGASLFTAVDTLGNPTHFGERGANESQVGNPTMVAFNRRGDSLVVLDAENMKLHVIRIGGGQRSHTLPENPGLPVRLASDSVDFIMSDVERSDGKTDFLTRTSVRDGEGRTVISGDDSNYVAVTAPGSRRYPVVAASRELIAVGNQATYQFQLYDSRGNARFTLGPARPPRFFTEREADSIIITTPTPGRDPALRKSELTSMHLLHFYGAAVDEAERLWVAGLDRGNNFIDIYRGNRPLGRQVFPCTPASFDIAIAGSFMAIRCVSATRPRGVDLQLFRIVEQGR